MRKIIEDLFGVAIRLKQRQKVAIFLALDTLMVPVSLWLASQISTGQLNAVFVETYPAFLVFCFFLSGIAAMTSWQLGLPKLKLNGYEEHGLKRTAVYSMVVGIIGYLGIRVFFDSQAEYQVMIVFTMILMILSASARIVMRSALIELYKVNLQRQRILIYGAGQTGVQLASVLHTDNTVVPVAFIDDNKTLHSVTVAGLPVLPPLRLESVLEEYKIDRVVLAMPTMSRPKQAQLTRRIQDLNCEVSVLPSFASLLQGGSLLDRVEPVNASDYLGRKNLEVDLASQSDIYTGRTVLVTGAGGSIGSELTRQLLVCNPTRIILFEISEFALYQLDRELSDLGGKFESIEIIPILGNVTDRLAIDRVISDYDVEIILHAAAYKHVPLVEKNPLEGLHNNVIGTRIVSEAARDAEGVSHFILISTDKAVNPSNVMGASKRLAELLVQDIASRCETTHFGIVRFGNVLGSSGSVIPLFEEQIARGGPITLTHTEVTRYFMTLSEAARLVLLAGNFVGDQDCNGDVFLLDMGEPISIHSLAKQMIESAGYTVRDEQNPDGDIEITITGLRPGEKLHEELAMQGHVKSETSHSKIKRVEEIRLSELEAAKALKDLSVAVTESSQDAALDVVRRWVGLSDKWGTTIPQMSEQPTAQVSKIVTPNS